MNVRTKKGVTLKKIVNEKGVKVRICFYLLIVSLFISVSIGSAQSVSARGKQDLACSSINDLSIAKGAKALLLKQCLSSLRTTSERSSAASAGSKFSAVSKGSFLGVSDNTADFHSCGHPTQDFYFETGFQKYSDSDGGAFDGPYVYLDFTDRDCNGNLLSRITCFSGPLSDGALQLTSLKTASILADVDVGCDDGSTLHLTANMNATADGFANLDKNKSVTKRETFNETNNYSQKYRFTPLLDGVVWDGYSYDLSQGGAIGNYAAKFTHEDL
jgi:hypothetical protein